ncbi:hypothetical protein [Streptomyces sp. ME19-01-6]|uniref:hypothetical protein n=1 Tax=Streptomyces sp. ME19-01-6 TaxID=3028686 RepID=UPI0029A41E7E|nr:hypothetical protein [Streptomyces sp. ME19-01-6]MDX3229448.1 hypothetical protein [Streptomyces sp. ME19-01-6]
MTPSRTRRTHVMTALALLTGALAGTAPAAPAAAAQGADWREAGHFDTTSACREAGRNGVEAHKWSEYKCRPGHSDNYITLWVKGRGRSHTAGPAPAPAASPASAPAPAPAQGSGMG